MSQCTHMRSVGMAIAAVSMFLGLSALAGAQVSIGVGVALPGVRIGVSIPAYPDLVPIPGYPVYYAPQLDANLFFYDGEYWLYANDNWYYGSWYDGPWYLVDPLEVPVFLLRVPIRYYRRPPPFFRAWSRSRPPHWGQHWGRDWERRRSGWDRGDRNAVPRRAPLPNYQRRFPHGRYPGVDRQRDLQGRYYHFAPRESVPRPRSQRPLQPQRREPMRRPMESHPAPQPRAAQRRGPAPRSHQGPAERRAPQQRPPAGNERGGKRSEHRPQRSSDRSQPRN
jgi:hypothetical protein